MLYDIKIRKRRLRQNQNIRQMVQEINLSVDNLIMPIFLIDGENVIQNIESMPNVYRYSIDCAIKKISEMQLLGIKYFALFPSNTIKDEQASEALNNNSLICRAIKEIKSAVQAVILICDIALDPYTISGHDGIIDKEGRVLNDETVNILSKQAVLYAKCGCDIVAPSDMMDGRIGIIRSELDRHGFIDTIILSYAVKYASSLYSPFRDAILSNSNLLNKNKKTYQMDFHNLQESISEVDLDIEEGADIVMVKPAGFYLDIIKKVSDISRVPVFAYQVSGEYAMIMNYVNNLSNESQFSIIYESLIAIKRAGAKCIITYFAEFIARELRGEE